MFDGIFDERLYQHPRNLDRIRFDIIVYRQRVGEGETELFELQVELQLFDLVREGDQFFSEVASTFRNRREKSIKYLFAS